MQTNIENAAHSDLMLIDLGKTEKPTYVVAVLESVNESFFSLRVSVSVHVPSLRALHSSSCMQAKRTLFTINFK